jgi:hypothetical protein
MSLRIEAAGIFMLFFRGKRVLFKHCDGGIRFYDDDEYEKRINKHIKSNEVTRIGNRIKVFQIDVPKDQQLSKPIKHQHFIDLVTTYFVWNLASQLTAYWSRYRQ